jgi:hypothetical protein
MKQETAKEVAEKYFNNFDKIFGFIEGAEWQMERSYSEEEVLSFGKFCIGVVADFLDGKGNQTNGQEYSMKELFDQFKKK